MLGGGDGLAVREVLKYPGVEQVTLVELDPHMTRAVRATQPLLTRAQRRRADVAQGAASSTPTPSAGSRQIDEMFDVIVVDFPDPTNFSLGKLYTTSFYALLDQHLAAGGYAVVQTTSPLIARQQLLDRGRDDRGGGPGDHALPRPRAELRRVGLRHRQPAAVAAADGAAAGAALPAPSTGLPALLQFPPDMARVPAEAEPPVQPGAGARLRAGMGPGAH